MACSGTYEELQLSTFSSDIIKVSKDSLADTEQLENQKSDNDTKARNRGSNYIHILLTTFSE